MAALLKELAVRGVDPKQALAVAQKFAERDREEEAEATGKPVHPLRFQWMIDNHIRPMLGKMLRRI